MSIEMIYEIALKTYRHEQKVSIEIADNGPGIPEEEQSRVFEPFFTTKEIGKGTGLGLFVSYLIITQNHQGTLTYDSIEGSGARFIISLPMSP